MLAAAPLADRSDLATIFCVSLVEQFAEPDMEVTRDGKGGKNLLPVECDDEATALGFKSRLFQCAKRRISLWQFPLLGSLVCADSEVESWFILQVPSSHGAAG